MLTSIDSVKTFLDIDGTEYDDALTALVSSTEKVISNYCNQDLSSGTVTLNFDGNGLYAKYLPNYPINSITSLKKRTSILGSWATVDSDNYALFTANGTAHVYNENGFDKGVSNYQIEYEAGYSDVPEDLEHVANEIVILTFKNTELQEGAKGRLGIDSIQTNYNGFQATEKYKSEWNNWQRILDKYRIPTA